jgi:hypothetical protein
MCFKNCFISIAYIQVNLGSIISCNLYKTGFFEIELNHLFQYSNMVITLLITFVGLELVAIILVSSANKTGLDLFLTKSGKSFIYRRKSKGPRMDLCRKPCLVFSFQSYLMIGVYIFFPPSFDIYPQGMI